MSLAVVAPARADYWHIHTVDSSGGVGSWNSLALDDYASAAAASSCPVQARRA